MSIVQEGVYSPSGPYNSFESQGQQVPTRVLNVRNLSEEIIDADLVDSLSHFGAVGYVSVNGRGTALVEFEDLAAAERCVTFNMSADIIVAGRPAFFSYSNMQRIPRRGLESERPSNVLIMYVHNAKYPITTEVINQICKPIGQVSRIIISRRDGIQVLVEFPNVQVAHMIKQRLNGCDIYAGCCTLKIEFAKFCTFISSMLKPVANGYGPAGEIGGSRSVYEIETPGRRSVLEERNPEFSDGYSQHGGIRPRDFYANRMDELDAPRGRPFYSDYGSGRFEARSPYMDVGVYPDVRSTFAEERSAYRDGRMSYSDIRSPYSSARDPYRERGTSYPGSFSGPGFGPMYGEPQLMDEPENCVVMIYGLDTEMVNCDRLFNLLCLYGNVIKIKFLKSKSDTCMVQMGDGRSADRVIEHLQKATIFKNKIHIVVSRQSQLNEVRDPATMPDGSSSFKDYTGYRFQRFTSPEIATKNRIIQPQKFLYFFNAPPDVTEQRLTELFENANAPKPTHVKIFSKREMVKNSAGIIEFEDEVAATEALMLCNHTNMECKDSKSPFVLKLCFAGPASTSVASQSVDMRPKGGGSEAVDILDRTANMGQEHHPDAVDFVHLGADVAVEHAAGTPDLITLSPSEAGKLLPMEFQGNNEVTQGQCSQEQLAGKVIQLIGLPIGITRAEVVRSLSCFGYVSCVNIPCDGVALVEFEEAEAAHKCIRYNKTASFPTIFNWPIKIYRMAVAKIARQYPATMDLTSGLILSIEKLTRPVAEAEIRMVFSSVGSVDSVAILQQGQNTLDAIVEFRDTASALEAKRLLNGCSMYPGCCLIYIEFVKKMFSSSSAADNNVTETCDIEMPNLCNQSTANFPGCSYNSSNHGNDNLTLMPNYTYGLGMGNFTVPNTATGCVNETDCYEFNGSNPAMMQHAQFRQPEVWRQPFCQPYEAPNPFLPIDQGFHEPVVPLNENALNLHGHVIIFGLKPHRVSPESLTGLLESYGRIVNTQLQKDGRKFLACIETADEATAQRIIEHLNGTTIFGSRIRNDDVNDPVALKKYQPHSQSSRVLRVSDFPENVAEADLIDALSQFGAIKFVAIPVACVFYYLLAFQLCQHGSTYKCASRDQAAAERCIAMTLTTDVLVAGKAAFFAYANMRIIPRQGVESDRPSNVLVMYVQNVKYPITTDVIHQICKAIAVVNRIIISRRDGVHALVEFPDIDAARAAKQRLNGCDIYANCCTLKIEFAKINRLSVTGNDQDQADYTTSAGTQQQSEPAPSQLTYGPSGGENHVTDNAARPPYEPNAPPRGDGLSMEEYYNRRVEDMLQNNSNTMRNVAEDYRPERDGRMPYYDSRPMYPVETQMPYPDAGIPYDDRSNFMMNRQPYVEPRLPYREGAPPFDNMPPYPEEQPPFMNSQSGYMPMMYGNSDMGYRTPYDGPPSRVNDYGYQNESAVIMIYGLDPTLANCDRLFNLLCLYGNVMKIKFLITRSDTVMVEMSDQKSAQRVIDYLHNATIFNKTIHVSFSRQPYLNEVRDPPSMHDGTPSYKEYSDSRLQRFTSPHIATKNRVIQPQKYLYFFNAPPNVTEDHLISLFEEARAPVPAHVKIFSKRGEMVKNSAGILQFEDAAAATEALMFCNHASVDCPGNKSPFIMKLCFAGPANTAVGSEPPDDMRMKPGMHFDNMGYMGRPRSGGYARNFSSHGGPEYRPPPGRGRSRDH
ncbi:RRM 5 and RRM 1 and RRM 6 domain containing prote in [Trichuris trichiura]|uniref:RRM 5 and RRM 1 and RRM 6 domain containing prote in n=1 Tax=Trichuris trichiura TaxID=36087 RepID=A0A077Z5L7_TRITR|nr:RRM 5 and RRM 1 and RRM 6 domain containing prote in [Trichuris trichiura]